jgi:penicillin-binding protein 2
MIDRDKDRYEQFTRRAVVIGLLQGTFLTVLGGRLAWLQVVEGQRYKTLADQNRINIKLLAPSRGLIVDRNGIPMALNTQNFRVQVVPEQTKDLRASLLSLQKLIKLEDSEIERILTQAKRTPKFIPLQIRENLSWDEVSTVEVNLPDLPGLSIEVGEIRFYPMRGATAHVVGYVGAVAKDELHKDDPLAKIPGFKIGKSGVEKTFDQALRGTAGAAQIEVNVVGREVRELGRTPGIAGQDLILSIDSVLQEEVRKKLSEHRSASSVVMDVHSGAIYAMASVPDFDPNIFSTGLKAADWEKLISTPGHPLNNKAISGQYPPGSTFKMITALAGLELGVINRHTTFYCPGHYQLGDTRFHCWKAHGHGRVNVIEALEQSCDTFFYNIANEIGIDRISEMGRRFGLGQTLGLELPEERPGLMPTREWKRSHMGKPWTPGETVVGSIGQGYCLTTALQLTVMTARMVNGGFEVKPWIVDYVGSTQAHRTEWPKVKIKKEYLDIIVKGMIDVVMGGRGTAAGSRIGIEGMEMGGKTGTAQVKRITAEERARGIKNENLPWHLRHHALFVGFAPIQDPRYACAVIVEHGVGGSRAAAPMARDILRLTQERNPAARPSKKPEAQNRTTAQGPSAAPDIQSNRLQE